VPEPIDHVGIQRVRDAAARKGVSLDIRVFDESTHTAAEAAATVDAELGQIVKSLVFVTPGGDGALEPLICLVSGPNRVDLARLAAVTGERDIRRATAREAQERYNIRPVRLPVTEESARAVNDIFLGLVFTCGSENSQVPPASQA